MANLGFEFGRFQGSDQVQGCKDCLNYLIPDPTMVGGKENAPFQSFQTWKRIKTVSSYIFETSEFECGDHST